MNAAGAMRRLPGGEPEASTPHAAVARRAVKQMRAAREAGDERMARFYEVAATRAVDAHLAAMRERRELLQ